MTVIDLFQGSRLVNYRIWNTIVQHQEQQLVEFMRLEQDLKDKKKVLKKATRIQVSSPIPFVFTDLDDSLSQDIDLDDSLSQDIDFDKEQKVQEVQVEKVQEVQEVEVEKVQEVEEVEVEKVQSKLVQRLFSNTLSNTNTNTNNNEKTVNGVSLKTELIAYRSRITVL